MKVPTKIRELVMVRDNGCCARCGVSVYGVMASIHHRKARGAGGTKDVRSFDPRNLVLVCGSGVTGCHGHIESRRRQAYATGWLLRSLDALDMHLLAPDGRLITLFWDGARTDEITAESGADAARLYAEVTA